MAAYPNTLAITAANSLVNGRGHLYVAPVLKATIRDLKRYLACSNDIRGTRILPVGYANADVPHINYNTDFLEYLYSGDKETTVDFWGVSRFADLGTNSRTLTIPIACQLWLVWKIRPTNFRLASVGMFASVIQHAYNVR